MFHFLSTPYYNVLAILKIPLSNNKVRAAYIIIPIAPPTTSFTISELNVIKSQAA